LNAKGGMDFFKMLDVIFIIAHDSYMYLHT